MGWMLLAQGDIIAIDCIGVQAVCQFVRVVEKLHMASSEVNSTAKY